LEIAHGTARRPDAPPRRTDLPALPLLLLLPPLLAAATPAPASPQELVPQNEDARLPAPGEVRFRVAPVLQNWHREFGPAGTEAPLAADLDGPLLDQIHPDPSAVLSSLNEDAAALGFAPVSEEEAALGDLQVREINANARTVAFRVDVGVLDRVALDLTVPLVRTELEPFFAYDPSGATLGGAAGAVQDPGSYFVSFGASRDALQAMVDDGELSAAEEDQARALLEASGAFGTALRDRVEENGLVPLAGTRAGAEMVSFYGQLQAGFDDFGLSLPPISLPSETTAGFLDGFFVGTLAADPLGPAARGWLAGETEIGLRLGLLRGFTREGGGFELRTTVGARARLPFRDANAAAFVQPSDLLGLPLGDGQRDVELSLYQDARLGGWLLLDATLRYGLQLSDRLVVRSRSPERPLSLPDQVVSVDRDPGDYLRARLAPRVVLNPFLSLGLEYRFWRKSEDVYSSGNDTDVSALSLESGQTRHRLGFGAVYRPAPPEEDEASTSVPEMGFVYQTAFSGSGGETPVAGLVTFHVTVPATVF
jgi:hypothetical protein